MQLRRLGNSDLQITPIGFGAWASGGGDWAFSLGPQDDNESVAAIRRAIELGINWIDTAPLYGLGHSEQVVERALRGLADKPYVFTKCGMPWEEDRRIIHRLTRTSILQECDESLRRLNVEVIDLYQIHWNKPVEEIDEGLETLAELQQKGKIRYAGVSNFDAEQMEKARSIADVVSLQPPYSLLERDIETQVLPFCRDHNIGVIVYSPMKSGLLSGKMTRERIDNMPHDDLRRRRPEYQEPALTSNLSLVERMRSVAERRGRSVAEIAVAWTLQNKAVTGAIVGMRSPQQAESIIHAAEIELSLEDLLQIEDHQVESAGF